MKDHELATRIADTAGRLLLELQSSGLFDQKALGKAGDLIANAFIIEALKVHRPDDAILSEEEADKAERLSADRVWIVDPLDGTREYGEQRTDWAVHIGLSVGGVAHCGAVALPGVPETFCTGTVPTTPPVLSDKPRMVVSRTRPAPEAVEVASRLDAQLMPMGSAGAKAMAIVRGDADIYLHSGGQYEWDSCAPVAVAMAAGLHVSRIDGSALQYNCSNPYLPDLLICRKSDASDILEHIKQAQSSLGRTDTHGSQQKALT